ncbi:MAG: GYD domain-containing protein [Actinomycetota bacterium]|nr:GYD domain-containing protein [Actinomycetota bacterium]
MASYVILANWTDQGVRAFGDTLERAEAVSGLMERMGGRMTSIHWTLGAYDVVVTAEFPDDETATAAALRISAQGNVRTTSMRAFTREEMRGIVDRAS